jgi:hypothetical protein
VLRDWNAFLLSCLRWAAAADRSNEGKDGFGPAGGLLKLGFGANLPLDEPPLE